MMLLLGSRELLLLLLCLLWWMLLLRSGWQHNGQIVLQFNGGRSGLGAFALRFRLTGTGRSGMAIGDVLAKGVLAA